MGLRDARGRLLGFLEANESESPLIPQFLSAVDRALLRSKNQGLGKLPEQFGKQTLWLGLRVLLEVAVAVGILGIPWLIVGAGTLSTPGAGTLSSWLDLSESGSVAIRVLASMSVAGLGFLLARRLDTRLQDREDPASVPPIPTPLPPGALLLLALAWVQITTQAFGQETVSVFGLALSLGVSFPLFRGLFRGRALGNLSLALPLFGLGVFLISKDPGYVSSWRNSWLQAALVPWVLTVFALTAVPADPIPSRQLRRSPAALLGLFVLAAWIPEHIVSARIQTEIRWQAEAYLGVLDAESLARVDSQLAFPGWPLWKIQRALLRGESIQIHTQVQEAKDRVWALRRSRGLQSRGLRSRRGSSWDGFQEFKLLRELRGRIDSLPESTHRGMLLGLLSMALTQQAQGWSERDSQYFSTEAQLAYPQVQWDLPGIQIEGPEFLRKLAPKTAEEALVWDHLVTYQLRNSPDFLGSSWLTLEQQERHLTWLAPYRDHPRWGPLARRALREPVEEAYLPPEIQECEEDLECAKSAAWRLGRDWSDFVARRQKAYQGTLPREFVGASTEWGHTLELIKTLLEDVPSSRSSEVQP